MAIRFLVDSTSDFMPEEVKAKGLDIVPLAVNFDDEIFLDNVTMTHEEFYEKLTTSGIFPKTSQPAPADFLPFFEAAQEAGDDLICILLSSKLSGTVQSAVLAKNICDYDNIHIIDSLNAITGIRALVDLGLALRKQGLSASEIVAELEDAKERIRLVAMVDTLEYLHKGGRLSATSAVVGTILKIKPLLTLKDGKLEVIGKARGIKDAYRTLLATLGDDLNCDPRVPVYYGYSHDQELCLGFKAQADEKYGLVDTQCFSIGATIGTHVGPGAFAITYIEGK